MADVLDEARERMPGAREALRAALDAGATPAGLAWRFAGDLRDALQASPERAREAIALSLAFLAAAAEACPAPAPEVSER